MEQLEPFDIQRYIVSTCKELKQLTPTKAAYLAGLIDGEGAFFIFKGTKGSYVLRVAMSLTHPTLEQLCNSYGGHWSYQEPKDAKPIYFWVWNLRIIKHYLPQILPYLKVKHDQATLSLEIIETLNVGTGHHQNRIEFEKYQSKLKALNDKRYPSNNPQYTSNVKMST